MPQRPTGADRRRLAALFLAANDRPSAVVQWLRLGIAERRAGDGLDAALTALLTKVAASPNENIAIGATLAARLGLERVHSIDDHSADTVVALLGPGYEAALRRLWSAPNPVHDGFTSRANGVGDGRSLLAFYRFLNDPRSGQAAVRSDMGRALRQHTPELFGRKYVAWWETRNLRMVANIRAACGDLPGTRVLSIVGSTHKPYFEAHLGMMSDTVVVKTDPLFGN